MTLKNCGRCKQVINCMAGDIGQCECSMIKISDATNLFLAKTQYDCLCNNCLLALDQKISFLNNQAFPQPGELQKGLHYYEENGLMVFTEEYHITRGYCCKSRCRHCAYGYRS